MQKWLLTKWVAGLAMTMFATVAFMGVAKAGAALDENRVTLIMLDSTG
ncbi:MAG: hypothetical protein HOJ06_18235 [Rhodospirillaceae bacterium]|jgi:hypothetical protein|nr:hypothetical protein [Rhodospirillaceae bacterium]MBT5812188.1 hypothetical protein [Rhodospirillaceae bacterium]